jgi:hypothetical protein
MVGFFTVDSARITPLSFEVESTEPIIFQFDSRFCKLYPDRNIRALTSFTITINFKRGERRNRSLALVAHPRHRRVHPASRFLF